ncbi:MAG: F0F1 ATP synthase subunit delta [Bauldia sp.]
MADTGSVVSGVAERYASALFDLARDESALDEVAGDLGDLARLLDESEDLRSLVRSPVYSAEEQTNAIGAVMAKAEIGVLTSNFVKVVARNRRLFALSDMIRSFRTRLAQERGELAGTVTSAEPLSEGQLAALRAALKDAVGKDVVLDRKVDPALIGGLVVQVGSRMVDTSLRTKLNALRFAMKEAG